MSDAVVVLLIIVGMAVLCVLIYKGIEAVAERLFNRVDRYDHQPSAAPIADADQYEDDLP